MLTQQRVSKTELSGVSSCKGTKTTAGSPLRTSSTPNYLPRTRKGLLGGRFGTLEDPTVEREVCPEFYRVKRYLPGRQVGEGALAGKGI